MSHNHRDRGWFSGLSNPQQQQPRHVRETIARGDWPLHSLTSNCLDTVEHLILPLVPPQVMTLLPEWVLRSIRREASADSPILAVESLNALPRPLQDADKDVLVGAILSMSSSLHLALGMLQEQLPQETSRDRLGEVLCPTLGHLLATTQATLSSFGRTHGAALVTTPGIANIPEPANPQVYNGQGYQQASSQKPNVSSSARGGQPEVAGPPTDRPLPLSSGTIRPQQQSETEAERFPPLQQQNNSPARHVRVEVGIHSRPKSHLVKALQAEMRVQAAIHVAIESLEFAEGQLKVVKKINQLHGGNLDVVQKRFYEGYNRLLFRALELQRRELELLPGEGACLRSAAPAHLEQQTDGHDTAQTTPKQHHSFASQRGLPISPVLTTRTNKMLQFSFSEQRPSPGRRNTIQGIRQEDSRSTGTRPPLRRRLSLADELAMVGEDSESGYQDETSEIASSASEVEESDVESHDGFQSMPSTNEESGAEESSADSGDDGDNGDKTLDALNVAVTNATRPQSRLPRLQQPQR